jgi:glutamine synthetase
MAFTDHVGRYMGKRYDADFFLEEGVNGSHACEYLFTIDSGMQIIRNFKFANWYASASAPSDNFSLTLMSFTPAIRQTGYGDIHLVPDMSTLRVAAWLPKTALILCDCIDRVRPFHLSHTLHHGPNYLQ